jgi:3-phytase
VTGRIRSVPSLPLFKGEATKVLEQRWLVMHRWLRTITLEVVVVTGLCCVTAANAGAQYSEIFVFGDSLSDTGNFFLATGGFVAAFPYFEGRFSNGPVWVEVMAEQLGLPAPAASLAGGTNYAWGGAETGPGLSFFGVPNVGMQIDAFRADRGGFVGDELIVVAAGGNDLLWQQPWGPGRIAENLRKHITDLAAMGGQTFLVGNSPLGSARVTDFGAVTIRRAAKFNELLDQELSKLEANQGIVVLRLDMSAVQAAILQNPDAYGLTNVSDPACPGCDGGVPEPNAIDTVVPNPDEYFEWDLLPHWTRVVHAIVGQQAANVVQ